jgi:hypothetical protein
METVCIDDAVEYLVDFIKILPPSDMRKRALECLRDTVFCIAAANGVPDYDNLLMISKELGE